MARARVQIRRRSLKFYNLHTGESLKTTYWKNDSYVPSDRIVGPFSRFRRRELFIRDPDGNFVEISQRASLMLDPG
jgi:hypothetical protein